MNACDSFGDPSCIRPNGSHQDWRMDAGDRDASRLITARYWRRGTKTAPRMKYSCLEYTRGREPGQSGDAKGPPREEEASRARDCLITGELMEHCLANGAGRCRERAAALAATVIGIRRRSIRRYNSARYPRRKSVVYFSRSKRRGESRLKSFR